MQACLDKVMKEEWSPGNELRKVVERGVLQ